MKNEHGVYICTFEDRIHKHKLPKGQSYVLQTTDISSVLETDGLSLTYHYSPDNPKKIKRPRDFSFTRVELLSYHKRKQRWGAPGTWNDYDRSMTVYSVPAKLRGFLRPVLVAQVLPRLRKDLAKLNEFKISVYYRVYDRSNYEPLDRGGLYIERDRYDEDAKVLYRNTEFDLDTEIREIVK